MGATREDLATPLFLAKQSHAHQVQSPSDAFVFNYPLLVPCLPVFPIATALTTENVVRVLKGVRLDTLCTVLAIPYSQQRKIEREFASEDQRRTAAVNFYLHNDPYASWRNVIRKLDLHGEHHKIQHYAEKLTGMLISCTCISTFSSSAAAFTVIIMTMVIVSIM